MTTQLKKLPISQDEIVIIETEPLSLFRERPRQEVEGAIDESITDAEMIDVVTYEFRFSEETLCKMRQVAALLELSLQDFAILALKTYYSLFWEQKNGKELYLGSYGWVSKPFSLDRFPSDKKTDKVRNRELLGSTNETSLEVILSRSKIESAADQVGKSVPKFFNDALWTYYFLALELQKGKEVYLGRDGWAEERMVLEELTARK